MSKEFARVVGHCCKLLVLFLIFNLEACKKFVQIAPPTSEITGSTVYSNGSSAAAVMTGLYSNMVGTSGMSSGPYSIGYYMGLAADELINFDPTNYEQVQFYENALSSATKGFSNYYFWTEVYSDIYTSNAVLEGVANSPGISEALKQQITGEAEFMRAFLHFYATNLYGDIPLVTSTSYNVNNTISRTPQAKVYQQILTDLRDAQSRLSSTFVDAAGKSTSERTRPNQGAAEALLARVYLYLGEWDSAEAAATLVINNSGQFSLDSVNAIFLENSTETIWQLAINNTSGFDTWDAYTYVLQGIPGPGQSNSVALNSYLINAFENGDERRLNWVGTYTSDSISYYYYPFKYQNWQNGAAVTEYTTVLRLAEQYLIRAEARAERNNIVGALADLNVIRNRAALANYSGSTDQQSLLGAILHERQVELFTEWGHRWFDLKRTNQLNGVMGSPENVCLSKHGSWKSDWAVLPIALQELQINPNLIQNPGY